MGVIIKPFSYIGKSFKNEKDAIDFFQSKHAMTDDDLDEMGPHLTYWLTPRIKNGFPECGLFSSFRGDENNGFFIGYNIYSEEPEQMIKNIKKYSKAWTKLFDEPPVVLQDVLYT